MDHQNPFVDEENEIETAPYGPNPYESNSYESNPYGSNPYGPDYGQRQPSKGFGIASLILGIFSIVFFCSCLNIFTGTLAIIFAIIQINEI